MQKRLISASLAILIFLVLGGFFIWHSSTDSFKKVYGFDFENSNNGYLISCEGSTVYISPAIQVNDKIALIAYSKTVDLYQYCDTTVSVKAELVHTTDSYAVEIVDINP